MYLPWWVILLVGGIWIWWLNRDDPVARMKRQAELDRKQRHRFAQSWLDMHPNDKRSVNEVVAEMEEED